MQRRIVQNLTPVLLEQLKASDVSLLLVLPGPTKNHTTMQLDWGDLAGSPERFFVVDDFADFQSKWQTYTRWHRLEQQHDGSTSPTTAQASEAAIHRRLKPPKVALLIRADNGILHISQLTLAAAISRHLRRLQVLMMVYSKHKDKGDSLLVFDSNGVPLQISFLATSMFRDAFSDVYATKFWGELGGGSGTGSSLNFTANLRAALPGLIKKYGITSMLDSSCGSMHWMPTVLEEVRKQQPQFKFMGTDVVCNLIDKHMQTFKDQPNMKFQCVDYSNQPLPSGYDLVFSRDSLQHIPMHGAWQFLNNVRVSGAKYLLVGSYIKSTDINTDVPAGKGAYAIDLLKEPFKVSQPLDIIDEKSIDGKHMLLFDVQKMTWQDPLADLM